MRKKNTSFCITIFFCTCSNDKDISMLKTMPTYSYCFCTVSWKRSRELLNLLHQLVMLGPKQPWNKKHSPEKVGQQLAKDHGVNYWGSQYRSVTAGWNSVIHVFSPILALTMLKFRLVSNKTNSSYPNC